MPTPADVPPRDDEHHRTAVAPVRTGSLPEAFGRYKILRLLGRGGMGEVYLAEDTQLQRKVAIKIPFGGGAGAAGGGGTDSDEYLARFHREARAAASLHHPNICPVYDVGELDGIHYSTMTYIEGGSLADVRKVGDLLKISMQFSNPTEKDVLLFREHVGFLVGDVPDLGRDFVGSLKLTSPSGKTVVSQVRKTIEDIWISSDFRRESIVLPKSTSRKYHARFNLPPEDLRKVNLHANLLDQPIPLTLPAPTK